MRLQLATTCQLFCLQARRLGRVEIFMIDALMHVVTCHQYHEIAKKEDAKTVMKKVSLETTVIGHVS